MLIGKNYKDERLEGENVATAVNEHIQLVNSHHDCYPIGKMM